MLVLTVYEIFQLKYHLCKMHTFGKSFHGTETEKYVCIKILLTFKTR